MKVLVIDVGGTNVKTLVYGQKNVVKIPSGPEMSAAQMVAAVKSASSGWRYDVVSIGFPGPVRNNKPAAEPANLGRGWVRYDYAKAFGKPVKIVNDAAMQALGSYEGGCMLFLGLGTGLGSALVINGVVAPLELAHLPYKKGRSFEDYVGREAQARLGKKKWRKAVFDVADRLSHALQADYVVLGGGEAEELNELPPGCRAGDNAFALVGGFLLWQAPKREHMHRLAQAYNGRRASNGKRRTTRL
jgi:polyphosphate glucokinase